MNIEKLIAAAKEIDRLADLQEKRTMELSQLASDARRLSAAGMHSSVVEIQNRVKMMSIQATDFGGAIADLRHALKARPGKVKS